MHLREILWINKRKSFRSDKLLEAPTPVEEGGRGDPWSVLHLHERFWIPVRSLTPTPVRQASGGAHTGRGRVGGNPLECPVSTRMAVDKKSGPLRSGKLWEAPTPDRGSGRGENPGVSNFNADGCAGETCGKTSCCCCTSVHTRRLNEGALPEAFDRYLTT